MIKRDTVFVLGAGASIPYGFPSGAELRHVMCTKTLMPGDLRHRILMEMGYTYDQVELCRSALALSWATSIDMFLTTREDLAEIGKAAIALTIASYERDQQVFFAEPKGDWFRYLWRHLHAKDAKLFHSQLPAFIVFNYDRVLEHAFFMGITHAYAGSVVDPSTLMPTIIHVYGSLGAYRMPTSSVHPGRGFAEQSTAENIALSQRAIEVIPEGRPESNNVQAAIRLLEGAQQVVCLGFGYDEDNLKLLKLSGDWCLQDGCALFGTVFGLEDQERRHTSSLMRGRLNHNGDSGEDCHLFLRRGRQQLFEPNPAG